MKVYITKGRPSANENASHWPTPEKPPHANICNGIHQRGREDTYIYIYTVGYDNSSLDSRDSRRVWRSFGLVIRERERSHFFFSTSKRDESPSFAREFLDFDR